MHNSSISQLTSKLLSIGGKFPLGKILLTLSLLAPLTSPRVVLASVTGEGDVTPSVALMDGTDPVLDFEGNPVLVPDLPANGGFLADPVEEGETRVIKPLVIGGTGSRVGGTHAGLVSINNPLFTDPLVTNSVTLGLSEVGNGQLKVSGFGSELQIRNGGGGATLLIGVAGRGNLEISGGGIVRTAPESSGGGPIGDLGDALVGDQFTSRGNLVSISGFGSLLEVKNLTVAQHGSATFDILSQGTLRTTTAEIGAGRNGSGLVRISSDGARWINAGDLEIGTDTGGGSTRNGVGVLEIGPDASASIGTGAAGGFSSGDTNVNELGTLDLRGGTLLTYDLNNSGLIRGYGRIQATNDFDINSNGELRNATTSTGARERLYIDNPSLTVVNKGVIESIGGEMTFEPKVNNESRILARNAILRFNDGLENKAGSSLTLGGETTIDGNIENIEANIYVLAGSSATLTGDLILTSGFLSLTAGPNAGTLSILGTADLAGAELDLQYSHGVHANPGDTYEILSSQNEFDTIFTNTNDEVVDDSGRVWDITYNSSSIWVTATDAIRLEGDFDVDGDVDGSDFLSWQRGFGTSTDVNDLEDWERNYGTGASAAIATANASAVPEPSSLALIVLSLGCCFARRRRDQI